MSARRVLGRLSFGLAVLCGVPAHALLSVSTHPTVRVSCSAGVCTATAASANLNVTDLQNMLAASDVTLKPGSVASDIFINAPVYWTSTHALGLDAYRAITVNHPVAVQGAGALTLTTNDGGTGGELQFTGMARVEFWDLSSALTVNGAVYTLENSIAGLASAIAANSSGNFALAKGYSARGDGVYATSPIATTFTGHFEGLGNTISYVTALIRTPFGGNAGLFSSVGVGGTLHDLRIVNMKMTANNSQTLGALVGSNGGEVSYVTATGTLRGHFSTKTGGLIGQNLATGTVRRVQATVTLPVGFAGLTGTNFGTLSESFAVPTISAGGQVSALLSGSNYGSIVDCYALGSASGSGIALGGLLGANDGTFASSYVAGALTDQGATAKGDVAAYNYTSMSNVYWDTTTTNLGQACEPGPYDCPQAVGLSDAQLKSGLPAGFDPAIWGQNPAINNGLPYLLNNPPS
jgi:hypothetical protein